ncbi:hypothetical protein MGG_07897 [Pyricularia oryzae 70-15]|uniref:Uncharacterized protein n=1 Tax=Pyricularia oryzae (strain 70-15 / ATCC MYA-4617 / FGSC 8958) TaxID=242507 RepID=G4N2C4_PYRO7|nr:uncharacterized protein MGG_07897 [Pyricularia oryzae 70-15]EHA53329.1 hypothetical protein MGG_07897 [Pyricularia oryzae 70-15]
MSTNLPPGSATPSNSIPDNNTITMLGAAIAGIRGSLLRQMDNARGELDRCEAILATLVAFRAQAIDVKQKDAKLAEVEKEAARLQKKNALLKDEVKHLLTERDQLLDELELLKRERSGTDLQPEFTTGVLDL